MTHRSPLLAVAAAIAAITSFAPVRAATTRAERWFPLEQGDERVLASASGATRRVVCDASAGPRFRVVGLLGRPGGVWLGYHPLHPSTLYLVDAATGRRTAFARFATAPGTRWYLDAVVGDDVAPSRLRAEWTARGEWLETPAGSFPDCRRLALGIVAPASVRTSRALDRAIWFSPDHGIVRIEGPAGEEFLLESADVGGERLPSWRECRPAPGPDAGAALLLSVSDVEQATDYNCGPTALEAVLAHYGIVAEQRSLTREAKTDPEAGAEGEDLAAAARAHGVDGDYRAGRSLAELEWEVAQGDPPIVLIQAWRESADGSWGNAWDDGHYVVVIGLDDRAVYVEDPSVKGARGAIPRAEFLERWHGWTRDGRKARRQALFFRPVAEPGGPPVETPADVRFVAVE